MTRMVPPYTVDAVLGGGQQLVSDDDQITWNIGETGLPFADDSIFDYTNSHRHYDARFEWMYTDEFMEIQHRIYKKFWRKRSSNDAPLFNYEDYWQKTVDREHKERLMRLMRKGTVFDAFVIELDMDGKLMDFQEGRHRAAALKEMGVMKVPVWIVQKRF